MVLAAKTATGNRTVARESSRRGLAWPAMYEATEQGWLVRGSLNADMKQIGRGPWEISVRRRDAKIIGINHLHRYPSSPIKIRSSDAQGSDSSIINHIEG